MTGLINPFLLYCNANDGVNEKRSTEGCSKFNSPETSQVQERLVSTLEHKKRESVGVHAVIDWKNEGVGVHAVIDRQNEILRIVDIRIENFATHPHLYKQPPSRSVKALKSHLVVQ